MWNNPAVLFFGGVLVLFVGTLIGAVIVLLSCALYNLLAGASGKQAGPTAAEEPEHALRSKEELALYERIATLPGVPRPGFDRAMRIVFFATLVNAPGTFIISRLLLLAGRATGLRGSLPVACIALPLGILVLAAINAALLPTSFRKGLLVSLLSHLLALPIVVLVLMVLIFGLHVFAGFLL